MSIPHELTKRNLKVGRVYFLKYFTAPKVWNGKYFDCLITDQIITKLIIDKDTGIDLKDWEDEIFDRERFDYLLK